MVKMLLSFALIVSLLSLSQADISTDQLKQHLSNLTGKVYLEGDDAYEDGTRMKNTRFNSHFKAVVNVESAEDVSKVLRFVEGKNVRLTIKSGGHDYIGRSSGKDSVLINLKKLDHLDIKSSDPDFGGIPTLTVGPGVNWGTIYKKVHDAGYLVVGGSAPTVATGGYTQGGGHSPLSPMLGLAVDSTLGFTIVTADGSIITTTESAGTKKAPDASGPVSYHDPDLFWAVRGGGGSTFGVVTSYKYKLHQHPAEGFIHVVLIFPMKSDSKGEVGKMVLKRWNELLLNDLSNRWSGYLVFSSKPELGFTGSIVFSLLRWGGSNANEIELLKNMYPEHRLYIDVNVVTKFYDYQQHVNDPTGLRTYLTNRFIQKADLVESEKLATVLYDISELGHEGAGCSWTLLGGENGAHYQLKDAEKDAVSPKFRTSYGSLSCGVSWYDCNDNDVINWYKSFGNKLYTIGDGVYFNEPDFTLANWKVEYWGDMGRYNKLLAVKQKYDPNHAFWCHHCVGSDIAPTNYSPDPEVCIKTDFFFKKDGSVQLRPFPILVALFALITFFFRHT